MNLDLKHIKLSEKLRKYLESDGLALPTLADAYLEISRKIYDLLANYSSKLRTLKKGYVDLLNIIDQIQKKPTILTGDENLDSQGRITVWNNKDQMLKNMDFVVTIMLNLKESRFNRIISVIAITLSIVSLIISLTK